MNLRLILVASGRGRLADRIGDIGGRKSGASLATVISSGRMARGCCISPQM